MAEAASIHNLFVLPDDVEITASAIDIEVRRYAAPTLWWRRVSMIRAEEAQLSHFSQHIVLLLHQVPCEIALAGAGDKIKSLTDTLLRCLSPSHRDRATDSGS